MANSRFRDTTKRKTPSSGTSKPPPGPARVDQLPQLLKYPPLLTNLQQVKDIFCYILRHPGDDGLSVLIYRQPENDQVVVICGDWHGTKLDLVDSDSPLADIASEFVTGQAIKFYEMMRLVGVDQAQFFFGQDDEGLLLYDVQLSLNKFAGPGMINDVFSKIFRTPTTLKIEAVDDRALEYIEKGTGSYEGDLLIKPSRFRMYHDQEKNTYSPLYVEVRR